MRGNEAMARSNQFRWQAPGNGRLFDSSLKEWKSSKMSQRCIGVLQFLDENHSILKEEFEVKIDGYLSNKYGHEPNNSNKAHFYRPLEFIGFIRKFIVCCEFWFELFLFSFVFFAFFNFVW